MSYFNLFLRGAPDQDLPFQEQDKASGPFQSVVTYPYHFSFGQLKEKISNCTAPYLVFADTSLCLGTEDWKRLIKYTEENEEELFGVQNNKVQSIYGIQYWPACFVAIPRKIYQLVDWEALVFQSLDYVLLYASHHCDQTIQPIEIGATHFDVHDWIYRSLLASIDRFAEDSQTFIRLEGSAAFDQFPAQFRIETKHQYVSIPTNTPAPQQSSIAEESPFFSIICPVFKSNYLKELIDSVLQQQYTDWELLLVVDGPPEAEQFKIQEIIAEYDDPRIYHFLQANRGTGPTRRKLSRMTRGCFVLSVDDDDELLPDTLHCFFNVIHHQPETKVFRASAETIGLLNEKLPVRPRYLINGIPNDPFEVNQPYVIERNLLYEIGGYEWDDDLYRAGEDTILFHKIDAHAIPVSLIDRVLYHRRLSTHNLTLQFKVEEALAHFGNLDQRFCPKDWINTDRKFEMNGNFQLARALYQQGKEEVITATSFFQFQTLGDLSDLTIDLEVTARCNAVCGFCPRDAMPDTRTHISLDTVKALADNIRNGPRRQVVLCGIGESLLHPKLIEIAGILREAGAFLAMTSNGALMTEKKFLQLIDAGILSFNFSVNAASRDTHQEVMGMKNYEKVIKNVRRAIELKREHGFPAKIHVSFVVCETNEGEVFDFVEQWRDSGANQLWLHPVNNRAGLLGIGTKSADMERFAIHYEDDPMVAVDIFREHEEKDNLCKIAKSLAFISSNGEMRLCAMDYRRKTSHGNIENKSLQQMHFEKLLDFVRGEYNDFCQGCDFCPKGIQAEEEKLVNQPKL